MFPVDEQLERFLEDQGATMDRTGDSPLSAAAAAAAAANTYAAAAAAAADTATANAVALRHPDLLGARRTRGNASVTSADACH